MDRRSFCKFGLGATLLPFSFGAGFSQAAGNVPTVVSIFLKGGLDGLSFLPPYAEDAYYNWRPNLAIAKPNANNSDACLDVNGFFGMHPKAKPLWELYQAGDMAIFPAVQYPSTVGSHGESQLFIESGIPKESTSGWLSRYLEKSTTTDKNALRAISMGPTVLHPLVGDYVVSAHPDLSDFNFNLPTNEEKQLYDNLKLIYDQDPLVKRHYMSRALESGRRMLFDWDHIHSSIQKDYTPFGGAEYPNHGLGLGLSQVAQLIRGGTGLEAVALDYWDLDTHSNQMPALNYHIDIFSRAINAFFTDLGALKENVILLVTTEFGRKVQENASLGTDHGTASTWLAIGGKVNGGVYGEWATLEEDKLVNGRDVAHTIDFRSIYAEVLKKHLRPADLSYVLPDFNPVTINFI